VGINLVHLHLLLNHVPTVGTIVALAFLLLAFAKRSDDLMRASLAVVFGIALVSLPAYMTGYAAQNLLKDRPGISTDLIDEHQSAALLALMVMEATGVVAWYGLWRGRRPSGLARGSSNATADGSRGRPRWNAAVVVLLSVLTIALMASAANLGGQITHPEIVSGEQAPETAGSLAPEMFKTPIIATFEFKTPWVWPMLEVLHFIGLSVLMGVVLVGNLRILGLMRTTSLAAIHQLLPWGLWAFVLNSVTGMLFFIGQAFQYVDNPSFHLKVLFMLLAGANVLYLTLFDDIWTLGPGEHAPLTAQLLAASQIVLWVGVIYFGRMLPYLGTAF
jgi:uncharacterized membrane protein